MDERTFELLEKLYIEMLGMRTELTGEIQGLRTEMTGEIQGLRTEMTSEIQGLRTEMTSEIQGLRTEMTGEIQGLHAKIDNEVSGIRTELADIRSQMATKADLARMEYDNAQKFGALFDGLSANTEAVQELKGEIKALKKEIANHEIKLKLVK